ncbi:MAG: hypothetical protein U9Q34_03365 [Elusimicrobiota bacterium]|nr:hypothetical protein [Elusimicrobiota bacterium]
MDYRRELRDKIMTLKFMKKIIFLAIIPLMAAVSFAGLTPEDIKAFDNYSKEISSANPVIAKRFLDDKPFIDKIKTSSPAVAAQLISKAEAVNDLSQLLDKRLYKTKEYELSKALQLRIDNNKALSMVGIGPVPEPLISWVKKYKKKYSDEKVALIERAIRKYEAIIGTRPAITEKQKRDKAAWEIATIRQRNTVLANRANHKLTKLINKRSGTDASYQDEVKTLDIFKYLDANGQARFSKYMAQMSAVEKAKSSLNATQLAQLNGQPIEQQMLLLGNIFDQSDMNAGAIETDINALRQSRPKETINFQENQILVPLLRTAIKREVKGTIAGDKLLKFYKTNNLNIAIASCRNCNAKFEPSNNRIVFDSDLIQQYMRIRGITTKELEGEEINNLAKYLAPMFIHEGTHQMQHAWADKNNIYKPYTQEDEIEANSMEALYTLQKLKNDKEFSSLMKEMKGNSDYAETRIKLAMRFKKDRGLFANDIRQKYYYGLPSFASARAEILKAISDELLRRESLDAAALGDIEKYGSNISEVMGMTSSELISAVRDTKTLALGKIQNDLLNPEVYTEHYNGAEDWAASMVRFTSVDNTPTKVASKVPALK